MANDVIEVTVKTLDSQNHQFKIAEDMMVKDFKEQISPQIGIPADQQRLIFRGRVLQDEKKINEYNVANNTIHVVQRPANASNTRNNDQPSRTNTNDGGQSGIIITAQTGANHFASFSRRNSAAIRIQAGNQMISQASALLHRLEADDSLTLPTTVEEPIEAEPSTLPTTTEGQNLSQNVSQMDQNQRPDNNAMEIDMDDQNPFGRMMSQVANAASAATLVATFRPYPGNSQAVGNNNTNSNSNISANVGIPAGQQIPEANAAATPVVPDGSSATPASQRPEAPRLREMALVIQDILAFQTRLSPYMRFVESSLRDNRLYENVDELQSNQYVFDTVSQILHYLSHAYHTLSDIMCDFSVPPETRRLRAPAAILVEQSTVVRATIPIAVNAGMLPPGMANNLAQVVNNAANANPATVSATPAPIGILGTSPNQMPHMNMSIPQMLGGMSQAHITLGGPGGQQINIGGSDHPHQINIGGMGIGQGGGVFTLQDLNAMLGPMASGMMPMFMNANAASPPGAPNSTTTAPNNTTGSINQSSGTEGPARPQEGPNRNPENNNGVNAALNNIQQQRAPFDVLLSCNSHHSNRRQRNPRPENLHQFVNVTRGEETTTSAGEDFLLNCVDIIEQSNLLTVLQPVLQDIIVNYLMRGRDAKNKDHVKSCAKSMAKKLTPFLESFTEKVQNRNMTVVYSETYCNLIASFIAELMQLTLGGSTNPNYKTAMVSACDIFFRNLMAVFKECFNENNNGYLPCFVQLVIEKVFGGGSLIFRETAAKNMRDYLSALASSSVPASVIVYKGKDAVASTSLSNLPSVTSSSGGISSVGGARAATASGTCDVLPPKQPKPSPSNTILDQSMDEDIDDLLNLTASRTPTRAQLNATGYDAALRNIPTEWVDNVRHDIGRQLGMPEQPPFSPGYIALLSRKPS